MISIVFILDHKLMDYRLPLFNGLLNQGYDITVFHTGREVPDTLFKQQKVDIKTIFKTEYRNLPELSNYEIVVSMQNLRILNLWFQTFNPVRKYKLIHWGIGVSSAKGLSQNKNLVSKLRNFISSFSDAIIFYSDFPKALFSPKNLQKTFVAHNTVANELRIDLSGKDKDCFLFIGSLNKRKGLNVLIENFHAYLQNYVPKRINKLLIIGDGPIKEELVNLVKDLDIDKKVIFAGKVQKLSEKINYFERAVVSISPFQAGLAVLESFSFGIPFITYQNAISGGEHLNIINRENGYLIQSNDELVEKMKILDAKSDLARQLGHNAFNYYYSNRKMQDMVNVFDDAFKFVMKVKP